MPVHVCGRELRARGFYVISTQHGISNTESNSWVSREDHIKIGYSNSLNGVSLATTKKPPTTNPTKRSKAHLGQPVHDLVVSVDRRVMKVNTMTRVRHRICREGRCRGESLGRLGQDSRGLATGVVAIATTERQIVITCDDKNGTGEGAHLGKTGDGEQLAGRDGLLVQLGVVEDVDVKVVGVEEEVLGVTNVVAG